VETLYFPELGFLKCHNEKSSETMITVSYIKEYGIKRNSRD